MSATCTRASECQPSAQRETSRGRAEGARPAGRAGGKSARAKPPAAKWPAAARRVLKWLADRRRSRRPACWPARFAFAYAATDIPDPNKAFEAQSTFVYYSDGKAMIGRFAEQNRESIPLADVPSTCRTR